MKMNAVSGAPDLPRLLRLRAVAGRVLAMPGLYGRFARDLVQTLHMTPLTVPAGELTAYAG